MTNQVEPEIVTEDAEPEAEKPAASAPLVRRESNGRTEKGDPVEDPSAPAIGKWYWYSCKERWSEEFDDEAEDLPKSKRKKKHVEKVVKYLTCVTHLGTNYVELTAVGGNGWRIHNDNWHEVTEYEPHADQFIQKTVQKKQERVQQLMNKVKDITARLSITMGPPKLGEHNEATALTVHGGNNKPIDDYKKALVKAKETDLPNLFEKIKEENESVALWMSANLIPLKAVVEGLKPAIGKIEDRIFNVSLYAGLTEQVKKITDGKPALPTEKIRIFQHKAFMDEECLLDYRAGGLGFENIESFDKWLAEPEHVNRLLPFPRCILAFQVRRSKKTRQFRSWSEFISFHFGGGNDNDKWTYLYIRNGEQLYRLSTDVEFRDEKLFPDLDKMQLSGKLYCKMDFGGRRVARIITEGEYLTLLADRERIKRERAEAPEKERWHMDSGDFHEAKDCREFNESDVYFDEMTGFVQAEINKHNRLVLILQGLLDRSPILLPHPPWQLGVPRDFVQALELIHDYSKALVPSEKPPDFEEYRKRLNASLGVGSVTVGQHVFWSRQEAKKYNEVCNKRNTYHHEPYGNPGPGVCAVVTAMSRKGDCKFQWQREPAQWRRATWRNPTPNAPINCHLTVPTNQLLNVSAYKPGDFKQFFNDPRTREDYLQWAPFLLAAEEYHAKKDISPAEMHRGKIFNFEETPAERERLNKAFTKGTDVTDNDGVGVEENGTDDDEG